MVYSFGQNRFGELRLGHGNLRETDGERSGREELTVS